MLRQGTITQINEDLGMGMITDTNLQEINFDLKGYLGPKNLTAVVNFYIEMGENGLVAAGVNLKI